MNKIICDNCQQSITVEIHKKYLRRDIVVQYLKCLHCGTKTLIDVTDRATREKQIELRKWSEQRKKALDVNIDGLTEKQLQALTMLADRCLQSINILTDEIKASMAELKKKYEGEL